MFSEASVCVTEKAATTLNELDPWQLLWLAPPRPQPIVEGRCDAPRKPASMCDCLSPCWRQTG